MSKLISYVISEFKKSLFIHRNYIEGYDENSKVPYDIYSHHVLVAPENLFDELFVKIHEINEKHREIRERESKENK